MDVTILFLIGLLLQRAEVVLSLLRSLKKFLKYFRDLGIEFPLTADAYELESKIGTGGSATVIFTSIKSFCGAIAVLH